MKKRIRIWIGLFAGILLLGYIIIGNPVVFVHNHQLKSAITSISEDTDEITLNEIVPFQWDTVYTFEPYATREEIAEIIGFDSSSIRETVSEGMVQLLFVKDHKVTSSVCGYASSLGYAVGFFDRVDYEENAVFSVKREDGLVILVKQ